MSTSTSEYAKILEELKMIKADAATGLEHDRAIMAFVFFNFVLLLLLLILLIMIYKIMPRGGKPPAMTNYMSPVNLTHPMKRAHALVARRVRIGVSELTTTMPTPSRCRPPLRP